MMSQLGFLLCLALGLSCLSKTGVSSFLAFSKPTHQLSRASLSAPLNRLLQQEKNDVNDDDIKQLLTNPKADDGDLTFLGSVNQRSRRDLILQSARSAILGSVAFWNFGLTPVVSADTSTTADTESPPSSSLSPPPQLPQVEMKTFLDPMGLFVIQIPKRFFALRRSSQGDLPDAKGQGRRGSSIFTAGDLAKAEVIAIERFPIQGLLEENGIVVSNNINDDLSTFGAIGKPSAVASLLNQHRERSRPGQSTAVVVPDSWSLSPNGKELEFMVKAEIEVQKPELLLEQYGISRLFRVTVAKASLESNDGNVTAVFCSALEQDYQGPDGEALRTAAKSFQALDQCRRVKIYRYCLGSST